MSPVALHSAGVASHNGAYVASRATIGEKTGEVLIHVANLSIAREAMEGNATLQWRAAGSALTPVSPLGDYELNLDAEGATVHVLLRTIQGPLQLDGKGSWSNGAPPSFLSTARVPAQHQQQLGPLLRLIAVERSAGSFELQQLQLK